MHADDCDLRRLGNGVSDYPGMEAGVEHQAKALGYSILQNEKDL